MLEQVTGDPGRALEDLSLVTPGSHARLPALDAPLDPARGESLVAGFERQLALGDQRLTVACSAQRWTYRGWTPSATPWTRSCA